jgi:hypothetical protein
MAAQLIEHGTIKRFRWVPDGAEAINEDHGLAVVFTYQNPKGLLCALAYTGKAAKPTFHYAYREEERRAARIAEFFRDVRARRERITNRRAEDLEPHELKAGAIIYNTWGYDQTNVDWYRIVRVSANYAWLQELESDVREEKPMAMCGDSLPRYDDKFTLVDKAVAVTKHRVTRGYDKTWRVRFKYGSGSEWKGGAIGCSWYA